VREELEKDDIKESFKLVKAESKEFVFTLINLSFKTIEIIDFNSIVGVVTKVPWLIINNDLTIPLSQFIAIWPFQYLSIPILNFRPKFEYSYLPSSKNFKDLHSPVKAVQKLFFSFLLSFKTAVVLATICQFQIAFTNC